MPTAELTIDTFHAAVLAVLAGIDLETAAADTGMDTADLHDALCLYQRAGNNALATFADPWHMVRLQFPDPDQAETTMVNIVGPKLDKLTTEQAIGGWWFIRKHPQWRIRLRTGMGHRAATALAPLLDDLLAHKLLGSWKHATYEPETAAFGGQTGIQIAHTLFTADTTGILQYLRRTDAHLGRREISVALVTALLRGAGLEWFEQGDTWHTATTLRPLPADVQPSDLTKLSQQIKTLITANTEGINTLLADTPAWPTAFTTAGHALRAADLDGDLNRGIRHVCAHHIIFHWNRLGIPARTQALLAHAAAQAIMGPAVPEPNQSR